MEFVRVTFPQLRSVFMDGAPQGQTGDVIRVERGHHSFDLGDPQDYAPPIMATVVAGTSQAVPLVIDFQPAVLKRADRKRAPKQREARKLQGSAKQPGKKGAATRKPKRGGRQKPAAMKKAKRGGRR